MGNEERRTPEHWLLLALAGLVIVGFAVIGVFTEPDVRGYGTHEQLGLAPCMPMRLWNVPCPGCGVTTSAALAVRGSLVASFLNQPFGLLATLLAAAYVPWATFQHLRGRDLSQRLDGALAGRWGIILGVVLVLAWFYKLWRVRTGL